MTYPTFVDMYNPDLDVTKSFPAAAVDDYEAKGWTQIGDPPPEPAPTYVTAEDLAAAVAAAMGGPTISAAGSLGATSTQTVPAGNNMWTVGTLTADHTMTLSLGAGAVLKLLLRQDATGGRSLTLTDGFVSERLLIPTGVGEAVEVDVVSDGTDFYYTVPGDPVDPDAITLGEATISRRIAMANSGGALTLTSGTMRIGYFTARKDEEINYLRVWPGSAAGATPTLLRWGIYEAGLDGTLTALVASIANTTGTFASTTSSAATYKKAVVEGTWTKERGKRYAIGVLCVTGATAPTVVGAIAGGGVGALTELSPRLCAAASGLTDLPSSLAVGSLISGGAMPFCEMLPS